jgi:hypothetical protein
MSCPGSAGAGCTNWTAQCYNILQAANLTSGYVNLQGQPMSNFTNGTWGITYDTCEQYCNSGAIPFVWKPFLTADRYRTPLTVILLGSNRFLQRNDKLLFAMDCALRPAAV